MHVSLLAKEKALTETFQNVGLTQENSRIELQTLMVEWLKTGLRLTDLSDVVSDLLERKAVIRDIYEGSHGVVLTEAGVEYLSRSKLQFPNLIEYTSAVLTLRRAKQRVRRSERPAATSFNRRGSDHGAA